MTEIPYDATEKPEYKFDEDKLLVQIKRYIDGTYDGHYAESKLQATEVIIDAGHGEGFCLGNVFKYAKRYGKKEGYNRKDLLKIIHYTTIMLHLHDKENRG